MWRLANKVHVALQFLERFCLARVSLIDHSNRWRQLVRSPRMSHTCHTLIISVDDADDHQRTLKRPKRPPNPKHRLVKVIKKLYGGIFERSDIFIDSSQYPQYLRWARKRKLSGEVCCFLLVKFLKISIVTCLPRVLVVGNSDQRRSLICVLML